MVTRHEHSRNDEVPCPACGAMIRSRAGQRVQCPRCREIVVIKSPSTPAAKSNGATGKPLSLLAGRVKALEDRIAEIEKAIAVSPPSIPSPEAENGQKFPRELPSEPEESEDLKDSATGEERSLVAHLKACRTRAIRLRVAEGSELAAARAADLKRAFESAGWTVAGPEPVPYPGKGLFFAVGAIPMSPEAAETHVALTGAGLDLISRLALDLGPDDSELIVA